MESDIENAASTETLHRSQLGPPKARHEVSSFSRKFRRSCLV